jgi:hypothetical protein
MGSRQKDQCWGGPHFWNLEPAGKGSINVGNTLDRSCRSDKEIDGTHSSKRNTERPREKVNGQQAGRAKRTHIELQTRAAGREAKKNPNWVTNKGSCQGGFFLNPKQEKGAERAVTMGSGQVWKT